MPKKNRIRRRTFLGAGLATAGAIATGCGRATSPYRFFTAEEGAAVDAICEVLIPTDRDAGAHEAGVVNYIDLQLTRHFRRNRGMYRAGLAAIDRASQAKFGKPFTQIKPDEQAHVLADTERTSKDFFDLILAHARQGYYGDPRHGGNRHMASWKMLGLPTPPVRGRARYEAQRGAPFCAVSFEAPKVG